MTRSRAFIAACATVVTGATAVALHAGDGPATAGAAVDLRSPTGLFADPPARGRVVVRWTDVAKGGRIVEVRTSRGGPVRRVLQGTGRITLAAPGAGRRLTIKVRACTRRDGACGRSARLVLTGPAPPPPVGTVPTVGSCPVRPATDAWNRDISREPVDPLSDAYIASIGVKETLRADFSSGKFGDFGMPFNVVPPDQPLVPIRFGAFERDSDPGPYPIPPNARIEGTDDAGIGDHHVIVVREGECKLYELYNARREGFGWYADSGAIFDLRSSELRPEGLTSADAAGLPILPGLARADEVQAGAIRHALRVTVARTQRAYVPPARHFASSSKDPTLPPMGLRLRLKASFDRTRYTGQSRIILDALARYGMMVADNGSNYFITGTTDPLWDDEDLEQLRTVPGTALEAVRTDGIVRG